MTEVVEPQLQFQSLTEAAVPAALDDPDPDNPIAIEVARLVTGYAENFHHRVEQLGYMPARSSVSRHAGPSRPSPC